SFFLFLRPPPRSPLFPYTTLFRSFFRVLCVENSFLCLNHLQFAAGSLFDFLADAFYPAHIVVKFSSRLSKRDAGRNEHRAVARRSEEHTSELQSQSNLVCRLLLEK